MKSIRLSLLVYFLILLTGALAAISWFSYRTTAQSLHRRKLDSCRLIEAQCEMQIESARTALDRRLVRQAHSVVNRSHSMFVHAEPLWNHLGIFGAVTMPGFHLSIPIWLEQNMGKTVPVDIYRAQPLSMYVEPIEDIIGNVDHDPDHDYFQIFRRNGLTIQRSDSLEGATFVLTEEQKQAQMLTEQFDTVELKPGKKVRRVALRTPVQRYDVVNVDRLWKGVPFSPFPFPKVNPQKGKGGARPPVQPRPFGFAGFVPTVYIHYGSDLAPLEARISQLQSVRDTQLADVETTITRELSELRTQILWVTFLTLLAIWLGGYGVIRLGLSPLSRMSEAVSQVSSKNFHLPLNAATLPVELRPVATRLEEVLDQLKKAFAREKQAAADISHELRTPLAALLTTLEVGLRKTRSPEEYRELLEECRASGQHMYQLVERLLTLARLDAGVDQYRPTETDVVEIALACNDMIRPLAKAKGIELRCHLPEEPIATMTDPDKLREVLVNLLHNAVEYNKPHGTIDLTVERVNKQVRFEVRDTGIGIPPEAMEHLFERFYRADPSRHADTPHAGLGLSIVKSYIELMGGTIRVDSSAAGTAFTVLIPLVEPSHAETGITSARALVQS